jgi:hypothetical protein
MAQVGGAGSLGGIVGLCGAGDFRYCGNHCLGKLDSFGASSVWHLNEFIRQSTTVSSRVVFHLEPSAFTEHPHRSNVPHERLIALH